MMRQTLQDALNKRPFRPLRVFLTDQSHYDITHPELCMAGATEVFIGMPSPDDPEGGFRRFALVDLDHVVKVEPIVPAESKK